MNRAKHRRCPLRVNPVRTHESERRSSIHGTWRFALDPDDVGVVEEWYNRPDLFVDPITVPGTFQGQGYGTAENDYVWDFHFETRTFRATYRGTGWYLRRFTLPEEWRDDPDLNVWIAFGGVHPSAEVWLNGNRVGENDIPFAPFGLLCGAVRTLPRENVLIVRVHEENRDLASAYNWQGAWSGLYRSVELIAAGGGYIQNLRLHPDVDTGVIRVQAEVGTFDPSPATSVAVELTVKGRGEGDEEARVRIPVVRGEAIDEAGLRVDDPRLWSPDSPSLYDIDAVLVDGNGAILDARCERIGFVRLSTEGKHFCINGEPYYMRGTGEFLASPETASPDWNRDRWRKKLKNLRAYGYNYVRCQTYCQTPEYLDAADEVGLLVQSEMGILGGWGGNSPWHVYQWPQPTPDYRFRLEEQWKTIVERDVNHASAIIYCMSNEFGIFHKNQPFPYKREAWRCYRETKRLKPQAFVIWTDGGWDEDLPGEFVNEEAGVDRSCPKPVIQHEYRWWSSFPDVRIMDKYSGAVRPYAAELAMEAAAKHGISHILGDAAHNSQRLQYVEAREKMESCRRDNPTLAGICHFNAMDTTPSPQGIIDEFFERKLVDAATWLKTNGDTVVMIDLPYDNRCFAAGDTIACNMVVSDFSHPPYERPVLGWELMCYDEVVSSGELAHEHVPYQGYVAGPIEVTLPEVDAPTVATLRCFLQEGSKGVSNDWKIWVYPTAGPGDGIYRYLMMEESWIAGLDAVPVLAETANRPDESDTADIDTRTVGVLITDSLNNRVSEYLKKGGAVLLAAGEGLVRPMRVKLTSAEGHYFFTPPANYPPHEDGLSATIIKSHRGVKDFPHEGFADLQFYRMIGNSPPLDLEPLGLNRGDPIIRAVHTYVVGRSLGYLVEVSVGGGRLLICSMDLNQKFIEARYLLSCFTRYLLEDGGEHVQRLGANEFERLARHASFVLE